MAEYTPVKSAFEMQKKRMDKLVNDRKDNDILMEKRLVIEKDIKSCRECPLLASDRDEGYYCNHECIYTIWLRDEDVDKNVNDRCPLPNKI